jgi:3-deoxy-D-manno-octulosonic-acid transferase
VPRHPQRFDAVADLIGGAVRRRSRGEDPRPEDRCFLGDTMGEMAFYYAAADVAIIGGSFLPLGGQNLIEACAVGTPVVFGPSMHNFAEASALALAAEAAVQVRDAAEAIRVGAGLLDDRQRRERMAEAGLRLRAANRGAVQNHITVCRELLGKKR